MRGHGKTKSCGTGGYDTSAYSNAIWSLDVASYERLKRSYEATSSDWLRDRYAERLNKIAERWPGKLAPVAGSGNGAEVVGAALRRHADADGYVPISALRKEFPFKVLAAHLLPALRLVNQQAAAVEG